MKKSKILVLVAALLVAVMALTACGGSVAIKDYINPDYDTSAEVITAAEKISALKGYTYVEDNGYIAVFAMIDEEDATKVTYKLVSLADASVVATLSKAKTAFTFAKYGPTYLVTAVTAEEPAADSDFIPEPKTEYTLYDVTGKAIATSKYESEVHYITERSYLLYDRVAYEVDAKGALTKLADIPEYVSADIDLISEDYFYVESDNAIIVYDHEFNYVSFYELPGYATEADFFLLDNGNYLVQYWVELDSDAKKYDIYEVVDELTVKYDLVTLVVSAEDGSAKEIKLNYLVEEVETNSKLFDADDDNNMYIEDSFENIVYLIPIEDGKVNNANSAAEIRFMDNKGKVGDSLKLYDDMLAYSAPQKIADDVYATYGATGIVLVNGEGEVLKRLTNISSIELVGNYFIGEYAIYSADLSEVVYDLKENKVDDYEIVGDSIFMSIELDGGEYQVVLFANGETKTIYNSKTMSDTKKFELVESIDGYYLYDIAADEYTYYNANGDKIFSAKAKATFFAFGDNTAIAAVLVEGETTYYFCK